ncbi:hypothetical protein Trydic_g22561 [Trypoxylus dichotomus]
MGPGRPPTQTTARTPETKRTTQTLTTRTMTQTPATSTQSTTTDQQATASNTITRAERRAACKTDTTKAIRILQEVLKDVSDSSDDNSTIDDAATKS